MHSPSSSTIITVAFGAGKSTAGSVEARPTNKASVSSVSTSSSIVMLVQTRVAAGPSTKVTLTAM